MGAAVAAEVPPPLQLVVDTASDSGTMYGTLRRYERATARDPWREVGAPVAILFGKHGLAWGRGLHEPQPGLQKTTNDGRAPAGRFLIGTIVGDAPALPEGAKWTDYFQKSDRTAWIDDAKVPAAYNHLYVLPPGTPPPPWFEGQRMRLNDPAHEWEVTIEHNYADPLPEFGNAIFFHIRRAKDRPSAGCTVMTRDDLRTLILWLDPAAHPQVVQLAEPDYARLWKAWDLPPPPAPSSAPAPFPYP